MTEKTLRIIENIYFFPSMFLNMTRLSFKIKPKTFQTIQTLPYCLDVWWSGFSLQPTVMNIVEALPKLVPGTIIDTYRGVPLQHSEMQKLYTINHSEGFFKIWFYIKKHLSPQHKQVNDKLVQSSRNLFNEFCHQGKYVSYEAEIYINNI